MFAAMKPACGFIAPVLLSTPQSAVQSGLGEMPVSEPIREQSPRTLLTPQAMTLLRNALSAWMRANGEADATLGSALRAVAGEARERGLRAEELLVTLTSTWFEIGGEPSASPSSSSGQRRLDEVVTACIKAYYG